MNYIYDITLNLNRNNLYDFYEWKDEDNPEFILKIPVYKIDEETYLNIRNNDILVNKKFLESIENKTESYTPSSINIIRYACVLVCNENAFAVEFDSEGNNYMKSSLSIEEETEIIDLSSKIKYTIIDYKIKKKVKVQKSYLTRREKDNELYILKKLKLIKENKEFSKLKYIFYEIYNEKLDDIDKIYNKLICVAKNNDNKNSKLNEILSIMENKKIMSNNS